jgi:hypothetical protein
MYHNHGDIDSSHDEGPFATIQNIKNNTKKKKKKKDNPKAARQRKALLPLLMVSI